MLKKIGLYLLQKRYNAIFAALCFAFLPFIEIPTFSIALIIIALVTLHKGLKEGLYVFSFALLPNVIAVFFGNISDLLLAQTLVEGITVCLIAAVLAVTASWISVMRLIVGMGIVLLLSVHIIFPDIPAWWLSQISSHMEQVQSTWNINLPPDQMKTLLERVAQFVTGASIAGILALSVLLVLIARGWQASLFNPGGLSKEWCKLRLSYLYTLFVLAVFVAIWLDVTWLMDALPILLTPFVFAGVSLVYGMLPEKKNLRAAILVTLYCMLLFFLPYACMFLIFLAFADSCYDFRAARTK